MQRSNGVAGFVVLVTPWGIPLVKELTKPAPHFWKIPGGGGEGKENEKQCAVREFMEEVGGVELREDDLALIKKVLGWKHVRYFFCAYSASVEPKAHGDEKEIIQVFMPREIAEMLERGEILGGHREILSTVLADIGLE